MFPLSRRDSVKSLIYALHYFLFIVFIFFSFSVLSPSSQSSFGHAAYRDLELSFNAKRHLVDMCITTSASRTFD